MTALAFKPVAPQLRRAKVLLIGEAGVGKTHAALTFPNPAVIDAEGSIDWFADRFKFVAVPTKSYADVRDLVTSVRTGKVKCDTLIIDSLTSVYNGLVNAATLERQKQGSDDLRPLDWGRIKRKFSSLLDELYHQLPVHVVCVGWIKPEYAKPGDKVMGKSVSANDLVKIGETFDGDRKTLYAFDFAFKILDNNGKKTRALVIKSRSGKLVQGQVIEDFGWQTLKALLPAGATTYQGMSDEEQETRDAGVLEAKEPRNAQPATSKPPEDPSALLEPGTPEYDYIMEQVMALDNHDAAAEIIEAATGGLGNHPSAVPKSLARKVASALLHAVKAKAVSPAVSPAVHGGAGGPPVDTSPPLPSRDEKSREVARTALMAMCSREGVSDEVRHRIALSMFGNESTKNLDATAMRELRTMIGLYICDPKRNLEAWLESNVRDE